MVTNTLTVYEMDGSPFTLPPRSRLYHLEPIGMGTPQVESMTSYVIRLAEAHCVSTKDLVQREILPKFGRVFVSKAQASYMSAFWPHTHTLNGIGQWPTDWAQALETLTRRTDLHFLSLLPWARVFSSVKLIRRDRAWCPACYEEWRQNQQVIYDPLLWTVVPVTACTRHRQPLSTRCPYPDCQKRMPALERLARPGYCWYCVRWLGNAETSPGKQPALTEEEWEWQGWVGTCVAELLAAAPSLPTLPTGITLANHIAAYIAQVTQGNIAAFARLLPLPGATVYRWQTTVGTHRLDQFLQVCYCLGISLLGLLTGQALTQDNFRQMNSLVLSKLNAKKPPHLFDKEQIQHALEKVLAENEYPSPSLNEVGKRLEIPPSYLRDHFPELCRKISAQYMTDLHTRSLELERKVCDEIRQAMHEIHAQGLYPSKRRTRALMSRLLYWSPTRTATWHETLRELGWKA